MTTLRRLLRRSWSLFWALNCAALLGTGFCEGAESGERPNVEYRVGAAGWFTEGKTKWDFNGAAPGSPFGNPTSRLTYKDVGTNIVDFSAQARFPNRFFLRANGGYGGIGGGRLTDNDYLVADGGQPSSSTNSNITGDNVSYVNGDIGYTLVYFPGKRGTFDLFIGYQYRREKHEATGDTQVVCTQAAFGQGLCIPGAPSSFSGITVITNTQTWNSLRLGAQSEFRITRRFSIDGQAVFIPYASLNNKDVHHVRADLAQNPSIEMSGSGIGTNLEGSARFILVRGLIAHVGYRYWWTQVTNGNITFFNADGTSSSGGLDTFRNTRQGIFFGLDYTF